MREKRFAIFVDGSNFSAALRTAGYKINYDKLLEYYREQGTVVNASYFTALPPKEVHSPVRHLTDRLAQNGWSIVTKEMKELLTDQGLFRNKGNMDCELVVKAMQLAYHGTVNELILCSGDGDFRAMVDAVQAYGVQVTAMSYHSNTDRNMMAEELRQQVNHFINLRSVPVREMFELVHHIEPRPPRVRDF